MRIVWQRCTSDADNDISAEPSPLSIRVQYWSIKSKANSSKVKCDTHAIVGQGSATNESVTRVEERAIPAETGSATLGYTLITAHKPCRRRFVCNDLVISKLNTPKVECDTQLGVFEGSATFISQSSTPNTEKWKIVTPSEIDQTVQWFSV